MFKIDTRKLLSFIDVENVVGSLPSNITGIESDSRRVEQGNVFICIKGYTVNGHNYIQKAIEKGAKLIIHVDEVPDKHPEVCYVKVVDSNRTLSLLANVYYGFPSKELRIIGVTGTNGKTTTATLINDVLRKKGFTTGLMGTICNDVNGEITPSKNTTSDALTVQRTLRQMVEAGVTDVVMEVSSHGLVLGRLWGVEFHKAIFTNLTQDHLDFHETMEKYAEAKGLLFSQLGNDVQKRKLSILNADDVTSDYYKTLTSSRVLTYGIESSTSDFYVTNIQYHPECTQFDLVRRNKEKVGFTVPFIGKFNIYNILAAVIAVNDIGVELSEIAEIINNISPAQGRMEKLHSDDGRNIYIDYAHTPDGIEKVLDSIKPFAKGKVIFLIGTGGDRDVSKRPLMTSIASQRSDFVVITTDNPRYESYESIMGDLEKGMCHKNYICIGDREEAIFYAVRNTQKDDILILAGKGHENYQIIKNEEIPFNDKEVAQRALNLYRIE